MISLITYFNKNNMKTINKFLLTMSLIEIKDEEKIELIFVVQNNASNIINEIQKFYKTNNVFKIKIIYCVKTLSLNQQLNFAIKQISNKYLWILNPNIKYENKDLKNLVTILKKEEIDIIEMKPKFGGIIKWSPTERTIIKPYTAINLSKENKIIAYTFPFLLNKVFSKKIIQKIFESNLLNTHMDSSTNLSIELLYFAFLYAKTYLWMPNSNVLINIDEENILNYKYTIQEWNHLESIYQKESKYIQEIKYAKIYYLQLFLAGIYSVRNTNFFNKDYKILQKKYYEKLLKIKKEEFENFDIDNKYMLSKNNENVLLKEIQPINKWNKIFLMLEK